MPRVSPADGARIVARLLLPKLAEGVIVRRPAAMAAARRLGSDRRSVDLLDGLRARYGPGPVRLRNPPTWPASWPGPARRSPRPPRRNGRRWSSSSRTAY